MRMQQKQFRFANYIFSLSWTGLLILMICVPTFIKLGLWQYNKAQAKLEIQSSYNASLDHESQSLPTNLHDPELWRHKKVKIKGHYDTQFQILLDNQVEGSRAGFHVLTPLKIEGSNQYVLVNRGWVPGGATHNELPVIETPKQPIEVVGLVWVPSKKIFTLESAAEQNQWNQVWQHMDLARYQRTVAIEVLPVVIKLDSNSNAGGFIRNWQLPADKIATNMGYAYQWFGFAIASILIFLYTSIKKVRHSI